MPWLATVSRGQPSYYCTYLVCTGTGTVLTLGREQLGDIVTDIVLLHLFSLYLYGTVTYVGREQLRDIVIYCIIVGGWASYLR